jgi:hypothetical protein
METHGLKRRYRAGGRTAAGSNVHRDTGHRLMRCVHNGIRYFDLMENRECEAAERQAQKALQAEQREAARTARENPVVQPGFLRRMFRRLTGQRAA